MKCTLTASEFRCQ